MPIFLMAIGSPPITWDLKHTGELWVYIGTPLPNPSGNTGVMLCMLSYLLCSASRLKTADSQTKKKKIVLTIYYYIRKKSLNRVIFLIICSLT